MNMIIIFLRIITTSVSSSKLQPLRIKWVLARHVLLRVSLPGQAAEALRLRGSQKPAGYLVMKQDRTLPTNTCGHIHRPLNIESFVFKILKLHINYVLCVCLCA